MYTITVVLKTNHLYLSDPSKINTHYFQSNDVFETFLRNILEKRFYAEDLLIYLSKL